MMSIPSVTPAKAGVQGFWNQSSGFRVKPGMTFEVWNNLFS